MDCPTESGNFVLWCTVRRWRSNALDSNRK